MHGYNAVHLPFSSQFSAAAEVPRNIGGSQIINTMSVSDDLTTTTGLLQSSNYRVRYKYLLRRFTIDDSLSLKDAFKKFQLKFQGVYKGQVVPTRERYERAGMERICTMVFSCNCEHNANVHLQIQSTGTATPLIYEIWCPTASMLGFSNTTKLRPTFQDQPK
jgi:hypothetical protein